MRKKIFISLLLLIIIYGLGGIVYNNFFYSDNNEIKNLDTIKNYPYTLKSNATEVFKKEYEILKKNLEKESIDEKAYAESLAKLFIIDLYTLNNKQSKYDVGGLEYVFPEGQDNYKIKVQDTLYKYIEENTKNRKQVLPEIKKVSVVNTETSEFVYDEKEYPGFKIEVTIDYVQDLEYDKNGVVHLIKKDGLYYVASKENKDEN